MTKLALQQIKLSLFNEERQISSVGELEGLFWELLQINCDETPQAICVAIKQALLDVINRDEDGATTQYLLANGLQHTWLFLEYIEQLAKTSIYSKLATEQEREKITAMPLNMSLVVLLHMFFVKHIFDKRALLVLGVGYISSPEAKFPAIPYVEFTNHMGFKEFIHWLTKKLSLTNQNTTKLPIEILFTALKNAIVPQQRLPDRLLALHITAEYATQFGLGPEQPKQLENSPAAPASEQLPHTQTTNLICHWTDIKPILEKKLAAAQQAKNHTYYWAQAVKLHSNSSAARWYESYPTLRLLAQRLSDWIHGTKPFNAIPHNSADDTGGKLILSRAIFVPPQENTSVWPNMLTPDQLLNDPNIVPTEKKLIICSALSPSEVEGVTVGDIKMAAGAADYARYGNRVEWRNIPLYDHTATLSTTGKLVTCQDILPTLEYLHSMEQAGHTILFHCWSGFGRGTTLMTAYLMLFHNKTLQEANELIREHRPEARSLQKLKPQQLKFLQDLENNTAGYKGLISNRGSSARTIQQQWRAYKNKKPALAPAQLLVKQRGTWATPPLTKVSGLNAAERALVTGGTSSAALTTIFHQNS